MPNNKFIPPESPHILTTCEDQYCEPSYIEAIDSVCDPYTFGPFTAPTTLYTHFNYERVRSDNDCCAKLDGRAKTLCEEFVNPLLIKYKIYQIIDGTEYYVGEWLIKDKNTPNLKKLEFCGEYILRYCSDIPEVCLDCFTHQLIPAIHIDCRDCDFEILKVCIKHKENIHGVTEQALLKVCSCCNMNNQPLETWLYSIDGKTILDVEDYHIVECC